MSARRLADLLSKGDMAGSVVTRTPKSGYCRAMSNRTEGKTNSVFNDGPESFGLEGGKYRSKAVSMEIETGMRDMHKESRLTPTRIAPLPPNSPLGAYAQGHPPAKPPRAYELSEPSLYSHQCAVTVATGRVSCKAINPVPQPRCRTKQDTKSLLETEQFSQQGSENRDGVKLLPVATPRHIKGRTREKENLVGNLDNEPTDKSVSGRLVEWQNKIKQIASEVEQRAEQRAEQRKPRIDYKQCPIPHQSLAVACPRPAPRHKTKSLSLSDDEDAAASEQESTQKLAEGSVESPQNSGSSFRRNAKATASLPAKATSAKQKKRNAPLPPTIDRQSNTSNRQTKSSASSETALPAQSRPDDPAKVIIEKDYSKINDDVDDDTDDGRHLELYYGPCLEVGEQSRSSKVLDIKENGCRIDYADDDEYDGNGSNIYCEIEELYEPISHNQQLVCKKSLFSSGSALENEKLLQNRNDAVESQTVGVASDREKISSDVGTDAASKKSKLLAMSPKSPLNIRLMSKKPATPTITIVRHSGLLQEADDEEDLPYVPDDHIKQKLNALQDLVSQELNVIHQTSNALTQCCHDFSAFSGSAESLECHRIILMACKKREAYLIEMQRLRETGSASEGQGQKVSIAVRDVRLPLKSEFMSKIGSSYDTLIHHFVVMVRCGCRVFFTKMLSTHDSMVRSSLNFPESFEIDDIGHDSATLDVEIYGMSVDSSAGQDSPRKKKKRGVNPVKALTPSCTRRRLSPGSFVSTRSSNFVNVASLRLTLSQLSKKNFSLERVPIASPLQGKIHLCITYEMENQVEEHGFLTMFEEKSGFGTWHRRWFVLKRNCLFYWKYPDDEVHRMPMGTIDLKFCVTDRVDFVSRSVCAWPDTFELKLCKQVPEENSKNRNPVSKLWLSADTKDERLKWCAQLNSALDNLRAWHPDAAKPEETLSTG